MPDESMDPHACRELLLARHAHALVHRELWACGNSTYSAYRSHLLALKARQQQAVAAAASTAPGGGARGGLPPSGSALHAGRPLVNVPATVKYSFEGVKHVFDDSKAPITCVTFGSLRTDLLAFASAAGELWLVTLFASDAPHVLQAPTIHRGSVTSLAFAYDNSQLLSTGDDGALVVWSVADGNPIRTIASVKEAFLCGRFHKVNPSLAIVGTAGGEVVVHNCSTGTLHSRLRLFGRLEWGGPRAQQVAAIDCSNHHVFAGDGAGSLHLLRSELHHKQLARLAPASRLSLLVAGQAPCPVCSLEYVPFCRTTDTPVLLAALQDGSLCVVRVHESRHHLEVYLRRAVPPAGPPPGRPLRPAICPLSAIQDVPLVTLGSEDTNVYIYDLTAQGGGGAAAAAGPLALLLPRPVTVTTLKAHRAPVAAVAWSYDEALLASADTEGTVVLWRRTALF